MFVIALYLSFSIVAYVTTPVETANIKQIYFTINYILYRRFFSFIISTKSFLLLLALPSGELSVLSIYTYCEHCVQVNNYQKHRLSNTKIIKFSLFFQVLFIILSPSIFRYICCSEFILNQLLLFRLFLCLISSQ